MVDVSTKDMGKERRSKKLRKRSMANSSGKSVSLPPGTSAHPAQVSPDQGDEMRKSTKKVAKSSATMNRISTDQKSALAESGRAVYVALPKSLKKRRSAAHTSLKPFLAGLQLRGLKACTTSGNSYYALIFDTEDRRDRAVSKISKAAFRWEGVVFKLTAHNFGDSNSHKAVIWQLSANLLATGEEVRDSIIEHVLQIEPLHTSPFEVRQIIDSDMPSGKWAVKFENEGPKNFSKQIKMKRVRVLVTQEPATTCRFCGNSGHNLFECTAKTEKELGSEVYRGVTGLTPSTATVAMEE